MARITRDATGLGPGPSKSLPAGALAEAGSGCDIEEGPEFIDSVTVQRHEGRARFTTLEAAQIHRLLQARDAKAGRHRARQRCQPLLAGQRLAVAAGLDVREQF